MSYFDVSVRRVVLFLVVSIASNTLICFINAEEPNDKTHDMDSTQHTTRNRNIKESDGKEMKDEKLSIKSIIYNPYSKPSYVSLLNNSMKDEDEQHLRFHRRKRRSLKTDKVKRSSFSTSDSSNLKRKSDLVVEPIQLFTQKRNASKNSNSNSNSTSSSSDIHKIRHAMKKLNEKGLDGVLRMIFDTNSVEERESNTKSNYYHHHHHHHHHHHETILKNSDKLYFYNRGSRGEVSQNIMRVNNKNDEVSEQDWSTVQQQQKEQENMAEHSNNHIKSKFYENEIKYNNNNNNNNKKIIPHQNNIESQVSSSSSDGKKKYLDYTVLNSSKQTVTVSTSSTFDKIIMPSSSSLTSQPISNQKIMDSLNTKIQHSNLNHSLILTEMMSTTTGGDDDDDGEKYVANNNKRYKNSAAVIFKQNLDVCYKTDDVLVVIAITCCLNFVFVLVIWIFVHWFSSSNSKDIKEFEHLDREESEDSTIFPHERFDGCWVPGYPVSQKHRLKGNLPTQMMSTSLYTLKPDTEPQYLLLRFKSYSMEDLHFFYT